MAIKAKLTVHVAWWLRYYLMGVVLVAWAMRSTPDNDKVSRVVLKALTLTCDAE
jgi:hypothetical protein